MQQSIHIPVEESFSLAPFYYLNDFNYPDPTKSAPQGSLLHAIRGALRGPLTHEPSIINWNTSIPFDGLPGQEEVHWHGSTVVLSSGGHIKKKWSLRDEGSQIEFVCQGLLKLSGVTTQTQRNSTPHTSDLDENAHSSANDPSTRPTFGLFTGSKAQKKGSQIKDELVPAIFVFLRGMGKIFVNNGLEFTFALPFIVRKAWPLYPHGVLIQRSIERAEMHEAEMLNEEMLPSIFSLTSPFSEALAIGRTRGIVGGYPDTPPATLVSNDADPGKALRSVDPEELVLWVSNTSRLTETTNRDDHLILTFNRRRKHRMTLWRYAFVDPQPHKPAPAPPPPSSTAPAPTTTAPLSSLPGMAPALTATTTMATMFSNNASDSQWPAPAQPPTHGRSGSLNTELSFTLDKMAIGGGVLKSSVSDSGRMKASLWIQKLTSTEVPDEAKGFEVLTDVAVFDARYDGTSFRSNIAICFNFAKIAVLYKLSLDEDKVLRVTHEARIPALTISYLPATRPGIRDLLIVKPDGTLFLITDDFREVPLTLVIDGNPAPDLRSICGGVDKFDEELGCSTTLQFGEASKRLTLDLVPKDPLVLKCLQILSLVLPCDEFFAIHQQFLIWWSGYTLTVNSSAEFLSFEKALVRTFGLDEVYSAPPVSESNWFNLWMTGSHKRGSQDPSLQFLEPLPFPENTVDNSVPGLSKGPHSMLAPVLFAFHMLGEDLRLDIKMYKSLNRLAGLIIMIGRVIRPEWADYWKRLCPSASSSWPSPAIVNVAYIDDRIPVWPPDVWALLYGRMSYPEWNVPWMNTHHITQLFSLTPCYAFGNVDPLANLQRINKLYTLLINPSEAPIQQRAESAVLELLNGEEGGGTEFLERLPLGMAAPLREAMRTCQQAPPENWPAHVYQAIGRNDLAASTQEPSHIINLANAGYKPKSEFINPTKPRHTIAEIIDKPKRMTEETVVKSNANDIMAGLVAHMGLRFASDKRVQEVARMLNSANTNSVRIPERAGASDQDTTKEQQMEVIRLAERTLSLPYGRAMLTFASIPAVTREAYDIPDMTFQVRILPMNMLVKPENGKIPADCTSWGDFHNGVASGLRISPNALGVESSWIAFNKPHEVSPQHAGFLFALGLTGHLRSMLTWHTFAYLTPKHNLTSIGVLLGLAAANVGTGNSHVTKLLAVHTPALLPTPSVDLNVPLMTQTAGLAGIGVLYMGTKNRRMADVCLGQISRRDLTQPDITTEHREAYTTAAALGFGMIMLGKGSSVPADLIMVQKLKVLIHGDASHIFSNGGRPPFDINLTSPAASIALGLMYLRTNRADIASILVIPDTVVGLNRIQPSFLLNRTLARSLIMWDSIKPTQSWIFAQLPETMQRVMKEREKAEVPEPMDDAIELAQYNIIAGACLAIGLKYAGTALNEAHGLLINQFDAFQRVVYLNGPTYHVKIKRAAVRDGLNVISNALAMVMAGTGEISCLRRLRYSYGMYQSTFRYGIHVATHMSLGMLFLGAGYYTLGTSDAAIASLVTAFYPRTHHISSDNKSFLQALRHLWVLAVEPRCLNARDVDSGEVVNLPIKVSISDNGAKGSAGLISPTLLPDFNDLLSVRVDTPRYWPLLLDIGNFPQHRERLLRNQVLYVKRRTAFLSYTEDPRGSRSLFARSMSSAGDATTLDFPQLLDTKNHRAGDLSEFITSFSNDVAFLAFAEYFARPVQGLDDPSEQSFQTYCHAVLLDSILQDKPVTLQAHLTLHVYRSMIPTARHFHLSLQDLRYASDFYGRIYDRRYSGRTENNYRSPLMRHSTVSGALHALDTALDKLRHKDEDFKNALQRYACGESVPDASSKDVAWYLLRHGTPASGLLMTLRDLANEAHSQCVGFTAEKDMGTLEEGMKAVVHATGTRMTAALGVGWSSQSLEDIVACWRGAL